MKMLPESDDFEPHRRSLRALAYRMLGSRADAEDVVQDAWLRWNGTTRADIDNPRAFLSRTVTRLCLDRLKSARAQRETYVGNWLPEPLVDDEIEFQPGPEAALEMASDLSVAFLLTLEKLSPLERAAFLLHDVFDLDFGEVAATLGRSESACRQLASRARNKVRSERPERPIARLPGDEGWRLAGAFAQAIRDGDVTALARTLAEDARFVSDGGGRVSSVPQPLVGRDLVAKVILGFARLIDSGNTRIRPASVNGLPGFVLTTSDGTIVQTTALEPNDRGEIAAIYITRNPDKLRHVPA